MLQSTFSRSLGSRHIHYLKYPQIPSDAILCTEGKLPLKAGGIGFPSAYQRKSFQRGNGENLNRVATNQIPNQLWQMYQDKVGLTTPVWKMCALRTEFLCF